MRVRTPAEAFIDELDRRWAGRQVAADLLARFAFGNPTAWRLTGSATPELVAPKRDLAG